MAAGGVPKAAAPADGGFVSIFTDGNLKGAGWASCPTAITWDADVSELSERAAKNSLDDLEWALAKWGAAAGMTVTRGSEVALAYDNGSAVVGPGGAGAPRRI